MKLSAMGNCTPCSGRWAGAEHDALLGVGGHLVDEPVAVADAFRRDQHTLGIEPGEDVFEALPLLADEVLGGDFEIVEEELVRFVVHHVEDGPHLQPLADGLAQIDEEDRHALALLRHLVERSGACEQDHQSECWMRLIHTFWPLMT